MKQPKKLSRAQKEIVSAHHLRPNNWMLVEEMEFYLKIIHKDSKKIKMVDKFRKSLKR